MTGDQILRSVYGQPTEIDQLRGALRYPEDLTAVERAALGRRVAELEAKKK